VPILKQLLKEQKQQLNENSMQAFVEQVEWKNLMPLVHAALGRYLAEMNAEMLDDMLGGDPDLLVSLALVKHGKGSALSKKELWMNLKNYGIDAEVVKDIMFDDDHLVNGIVEAATQLQPAVVKHIFNEIVKDWTTYKVRIGNKRYFIED